MDAPPALMQAQLSPEQVDVLIGYALGPGGLAAADAVYDDRFVTDQNTTTFIIDADGVSKTVSAYALGLPEPRASAPMTPSWPAWPPWRTPSPTSTRRWRQVTSSHRRSTSRPSTWPSSRPTPRTARRLRARGPSRMSSWSCPLTGQRVTLTLTPEQVSQVTTVPTGGVGGLIYTTSDGQRVSVTIRPMLPGEQAPMTAA